MIFFVLISLYYSDRLFFFFLTFIQVYAKISIPAYSISPCTVLAIVLISSPLAYASAFAICTIDYKSNCLIYRGFHTRKLFYCNQDSLVGVGPQVQVSSLRGKAISIQTQPRAALAPCVTHLIAYS